MNQIVNIKGNNYSFTYSDTSNIWMGNLVIDNNKISIEILSKEFETNEFKEFIEFIETKNLISELTTRAEKLLKNYIDIVRFGIDEDINKYSFRLEGILYRGKYSTAIFEDAFNYSFLFRLYSEKYVECDDPYGLYLTDIENALIKGIRREQV